VLAKSYPIRQWVLGDRPRERLLSKGAAALSDVELIAILLNTGSHGTSAVELARLLLRQTGSILALGKCSAAKLKAYPGMGPAKVARLLAACELGRRREQYQQVPRPLIQCASDAARLLFAKIRDVKHECIVVILLDTKHRVIGESLVSMGSLDQASVHPRDVFRPALENSAAAVIVAHNHPSGDPKPSQTDVQLTERLQEAAYLLGIRLLDHIIIGDGVFISLAEKGYIKGKINDKFAKS